MKEKLFVFILIILAVSCVNDNSREEVFPNEGQTTYKTKQGNTYSKFCIGVGGPGVCYCEKNSGYNTATTVPCEYFDEVERLYEKFNHIGQ